MFKFDMIVADSFFPFERSMMVNESFPVSSFAKKRARTKIVNGNLALKFRRMLRSSFLLSPGRL